VASSSAFRGLLQEECCRHAAVGWGLQRWDAGALIIVVAYQVHTFVHTVEFGH
jgi:hypothetical protein